MRTSVNLNRAARICLLSQMRQYPGRHLSCVVYVDDEAGRLLAESTMYRWRWHNWITRAQRDVAIYRIHCALPTSEPHMLSLLECED